MAAESTDKVIRALRNALGLDGSGPTDAELLTRFVEKRDPAAFEALVCRHGALVRGVCRRILMTDADADDAFQATFLVFARKAPGIRKRDSVGSWLHGVARQIARQLQTQLAVRRRRERQEKAREGYASMNVDPVQSASLRELVAVLDEELAKLSAACRAALVACYLEAQTAAAAARQLGIPASTLKTRLERGTELLRKRLLGRGIDMSAVALAVVLGEQSRVSAAPALIDATVKAALSFATTGTAAVSTQVIALATKAIRTMVIAKATTGFLAASILGLLGIFSAAVAVPQKADPKEFPPDPLVQVEVAAHYAGKDRHGDPLPAGAIARLGTIRWRHDRVIGFASFLPDGKSVVTVGDDMTMRVWEHPSGRELRRLNLAPSTLQMISPDARVTYFSAAAMSSDGTIIATNMGDTGIGEIRLREIATGKELASLKVEFMPISMAFSGNGQRLAVLDYAGPVYVWDWAHGKQVSKFEATTGHSRPQVLAFSPDGKIVAAIKDLERPAGKPVQNDVLKIWNADTGAEIGPVDDGKNVEPLSMAFSPDSKMLAFTKSSGTVHLVAAIDGKAIRTIRGKAPFDAYTLLFSKDGSKLYSRMRKDKRLKEWDIASGQLLREIGSPWKSGFDYNSVQSIDDRMSLSSDGNTLVLTGAEHCPIFIDIPSGKEVASIGGHSKRLSNVRFSADGKRILTQDINPIIRAWDAVTGNDLGAFDLPINSGRYAVGPDHVAVSPDERHIARAQNGLSIIDRVSGEILSKPKATSRFLAKNQLIFSGDGRRLAWSSPLDAKIDVFESPSGKLLHTLQNSADLAQPRNPGIWSDAPPHSIVMSSDGATLASFADARTTVVWDLMTGKRRGTLSLSDEERPQSKKRDLGEWPLASGAFSPDSRCLAYDRPDGTVVVYELATGKTRSTYGRRPGDAQKKAGYFGGPMTTDRGEREAGPRLAYSPDGSLLAHASPDQCIHLWDVATGQELEVFRGHTAPLTCLAFSPDGKSIVSGGWDTTALVWDVLKWKRGAKSVAKLGPEQLANHWEKLTDSDSAKAFDAIVTITAASNDAVAFIEQRLKPAARIERGRIERLVAELDNSDFKVRDKANGELLEIADRAAPALEKALANNPPLETRRRLEALLEKSGTQSMILQGDRLRACRAVEVLERIGTSEARRLLMSFANGAPGAILTTSAEAALRR